MGTWAGFALLIAAASPCRAEKARLEVGHIHVAVRDLPGAVQWLDQVLEWKALYQSSGMAIVPAGPIRLMLDAGKTDSEAILAVASKDVDADYRRLLERGAVSLEAPNDKPYGARAAYLKGPGALRLEIEGPLAEPATGFAYTELAPGTGPSPQADSTVKVHYAGTLADGTVFDGSHRHGRPALLPLGSAIACWGEALKRMKVGAKARFVCPPQMAYGEAGRPPKIPPRATLFFEVELLDILP